MLKLPQSGNEIVILDFVRDADTGPRYTSRMVQSQIIASYV
jgi:hypothetical protein